MRGQTDPAAPLFENEEQRLFFPGSAPVWKANLLIFGLLIIAVLGYFFIQARQAEKVFLNDVKDHAGMLAGVVRLNAAGAVMSREVVGEIMQTFLQNSAHFIDYLDSVEEFTEEELTALAKETGLSGIRITLESGKHFEGPKGWFPKEHQTSKSEEYSLRRIKERSLFYLRYPRFESGFLIVGITSGRFEELQEKIGLPFLLKTLTGLAGIKYVTIENGNSAKPEDREAGRVKIIGTGLESIAEARLPLGTDTIVVGMDATNYFVRAKRLWYEFFIFGGVTALAGLFCSWLLYSYQKSHIHQATLFERKLAREREDAALGRATASIAHEIKNPLNAISMGLQRLKIEADELEQEHTELIDNLLNSIKRTDRIISDLKRYSGPLTPHKRNLNPDTIVRNILSLYAHHFDPQTIVLNYTAEFTGHLPADRDLFEILIENLVKNAVEAQENGGFLNITLSSKKNHLFLSFSNSGYEKKDENPEMLLEPYYTTKTRGSGLGMTIVKNIVEAHDGTLSLHVPAEGVLEINILIPLYGVK